MKKEKKVLDPKVMKKLAQVKKPSLTEIAKASKGRILIVKKTPDQDVKKLSGPDQWRISATKCKICGNRIAQNVTTGTLRCSFVGCKTRINDQVEQRTKVNQNPAEAQKQARERLQGVVGKDGEPLAKGEKVEKSKKVRSLPFIVEGVKPLNLKITKIQITQEGFYSLKKIMGIEGEEIAFNSEEIHDLILTLNDQDEIRIHDLCASIAYMLEHDRIDEVVLYQ